MAEEQELTVEAPQLTPEAIKQRKKREKAAAKDAALGVTQIWPPQSSRAMCIIAGSWEQPITRPA